MPASWVTCLLVALRVHWAPALCQEFTSVLKSPEIEQTCSIFSQRPRPGDKRETSEQLRCHLSASLIRLVQDVLETESKGTTVCWSGKPFRAWYLRELTPVHQTAGVLNSTARKITPLVANFKKILLKTNKTKITGRPLCPISASS